MIMNVVTMNINSCQGLMNISPGAGPSGRVEEGEELEEDREDWGGAEEEEEGAEPVCGR